MIERFKKGSGLKMTKIQMKRVYEEVSKKDGYRILVDRLWPRGVKKEELPYDLWAKKITPSSEIRKAFNHEEEKFATFKNDYRYELNENPEVDNFIETVADALKEGNVTLLYAAKNEKVNHVVILKDYIEEQLSLTN